MQHRLQFLLSLVVTCAWLGGCATAPASPPAASAPQATPSTATPASMPAAANDATAGYRPVQRKGVQLFCKTERITGSRTQTNETCLTAKQLEMQRNNSQNLLRDLDRMNTVKPNDRGGGVYNSVMTQ